MDSVLRQAWEGRSSVVRKSAGARWVLGAVLLAAFASGSGGAGLGSASNERAAGRAASRLPNVILVITDDQGYGDLGVNGNEVIRTPNLSAQEAEILGDSYYSFKLDHVRYFSANSLNEMMHGVKMKAVFSETASHLFKGILGADYLFKLGQARRGADILALYERA